MKFVRVCIFCIVDAKQPVKGIFASVARRCTGDLCPIHPFLVEIFTGKSSGRRRFSGGVGDARRGFHVVAIADIDNVIAKVQRAFMRFEQRFDCFENILAAPILVFPETVILPLGSFQFRLDSD